MRESATVSFVHFFFGFLLFISLSVGLTIAINSYTIKQSALQHAAAMEALMLEWH